MENVVTQKRENEQREEEMDVVAKHRGGDVRGWT